MILLTLSKDNQLIKEYTLAEEEVTIGRASDNTMQVDDPNVEDHHIRLVYRFSIWQLEDLSNGKTLIDNNPVGKANLSNGDEIDFVGYRMSFYATDEGTKGQNWNNFEQQKTWKLTTGRP